MSRETKLAVTAGVFAVMAGGYAVLDSWLGVTVYNVLACLAVVGMFRDGRGQSH